MPAFSLTDNLLLTRCPAFTRFGFVDRNRARKRVSDILARRNISAPAGPDTLAAALSGGNLQRFLLGRELDASRPLLIVHAPTQGVDIRATEEIWRELLAHRQHGGVLLFTNELREALSLADTVAVMFQGRILAVLPADHEARIERIGLLMAGVEDAA